MLSILYYIWLAAICTVVLVLSVAVLALTYPFQKSRRIVHEMSRYLALSFLLPFPRRVEGLENVDRRERYVIVLNHQAMVDIGALYHVPLNFRWVSKREVFRIPFFGQFLLVHGDICIDRGRAAEALEQLLRDGGLWLSRGASVAIFPEGTRSETGEVGEFKAGAFKIAQKNKVPVVALVGYTNAGKSTLLNTLSGADVLAEDKLFATLDPVVRTVKTPAGGEFLLPHALVDAFHSTLEEALLADVLLIVSDGASGEMIRQHDVVLEVLSSLGAADKPMIDVINKADLPGVTANEWPGAIAISAKKGEGLDALLEAIRLKLRGTARPMRAVIPYAQGGLLAKLHADGQVLGEEYTAEGIDVTALADEQLFGRLAAQLGEQAVTWQD